MRVPRGIFVKLVTIFLVVGLVPFLGLSAFMYGKARDRMTATVVEYWLVRQARETAAGLDREVQEMRAMIRSWADDGFLGRKMAGAQEGESQDADLTILRDFLARRKQYRQDLDLLLLVSRSGEILAEGRESSGFLQGKQLRDLVTRQEDRAWIEAALDPAPQALQQTSVPVSTCDWHVSSLVRLARGEPVPEGYPKDASAYAVGFAATILDPDDGDPVGALVSLFSWSRIQGLLDQVTARFQSRDDPRKEGRRYPSGYPFLFAANLDTIIAHEDHRLLGNSLSGDHGLPEFSHRMQSASYGAHEYEYPPGTRKISAFAHTDGGGFGWAVGVGINDDEVYADVLALRDFMIIAALILAGVVILMAAIFSHRITEPITRLIAYTEEVARGNLEGRVDIRTRDEIAVLADSFNKMAEDLKESNRRLIKAEKDAAWSEMARQVAHEIKNPLTPIMLSAQQLKRAHEDHHPAFDEILTDSVNTIVEQCEGLKRIASDFATFASFPARKLARHDVGSLVQAAVDLYRGRTSSDVAVTCTIAVAPDVAVLADKDEIRRVFLNLFNNAMEAMPKGGRLTVTVSEAKDEPIPSVAITVTDTGRGIAAENHERLFEPYFSTRTGGTGLGLAICRRIVNEHGGRIDVDSAIGKGTTFTMTLPIARNS